ncbi:MAG: hypothetical protein V7K37_21470 [Nostoc sp.]
MAEIESKDSHKYLFPAAHPEEEFTSPRTMSTIFWQALRSVQATGRCFPMCNISLLSGDSSIVLAG